MIDQGELLFARQRMVDFLTGKGPSGWNIRDPERIARELERGIRDYLRKGAEPPAELDVSWALTLPDTLPESAEASVSRLPPEVIVSYSMTGQRALQYLHDIVTPRQMPGLANRRAPLNHYERARLRRAAAAIEDPVGRIVAPEYLSADAVTAIAAVYPTLYAETVAMVGDAVAAAGRILRAREEAALAKLVGAPVQPNGALKGPDQTQAGNDRRQRRPRGKPPESPDVRPATQRLPDRS